jgi:hypothetical protein
MFGEWIWDLLCWRCRFAEIDRGLRIVATHKSTAEVWRLSLTSWRGWGVRRAVWPIHTDLIRLLLLLLMLLSRLRSSLRARTSWSKCYWMVGHGLYDYFSLRVGLGLSAAKVNGARNDLKHEVEAAWMCEASAVNLPFPSRMLQISNLIDAMNVDNTRQNAGI